MVERKFWRAANHDKLTAQTKAYRETNPIWERLCAINQFATERGCTGKLTLGELEVMLSAVGTHCPACHKPFGEGRSKWSFDHGVPVSQGGLHSVENGQIICWRCNELKADKTIRF